jgi:hypothetical protein
MAGRPPSALGEIDAVSEAAVLAVAMAANVPVNPSSTHRQTYGPRVARTVELRTGLTPTG